MKNCKKLLWKVAYLGQIEEIFCYTANALTIETMEYNHVPNPIRLYTKTIETVVIILDYLDFKIQILFSLVSENYALMPIKIVQNCKVHSQ